MNTEKIQSSSGKGRSNNSKNVVEVIVEIVDGKLLKERNWY